MSSVKVLALKADHGGCASYRIVEPARVINEAGTEFSITVDTGILAESATDSKTRITTVTKVVTDVDMIVCQRPLNNWFASMIEQAQRQGITCVVELDDDFENVHPKNIAWPHVQPNLHPDSNYEWIKKSCALADWVTVSTDALLRYAPHGRASVVGNYVPAKHISSHAVRPRTGQARVGWSGTLQTHPADLQVVGGSVNQVLRDNQASLAVLGDGAGVRDALSLAKSIPVAVAGWVPTDQYFDALYGFADIGMVPLTGTPFNTAKSHIKGLEYSACGIPYVASSLHEYRRLRQYGIGRLADSPRDWRRLIQHWIRNEDARLEAAEIARNAVKEHFVLEDHVENWCTAWRSALAVKIRA